MTWNAGLGLTAATTRTGTALDGVTLQERTRLLGAGGFGQVYLADRLGRSKTVPKRVCVKVSTRIDGWLREAYFGQLLDAHPRTIRVYDTFPTVRPGDR